jgi:hypothetical protein
VSAARSAHRALILAGALGLSACPRAAPPEAGPDAGPDAPTPDEAAVCADELAWFDTEIRAPILELKCAGCHQLEGPARHTRLRLEADREASFRSVRRVARDRLGGVSVLLLRPTLEHPEGHTGGRLVEPGSGEHAALERLVAMLDTDACDPPRVEPAPSCEAIRPGPRRLRRLTGAEYDQSVRDLLGLPSDHGARFVADPVVHGFDNHADALAVSPLLADQLREAAESLSAAASSAAPWTRASSTATAPSSPATDCAGRSSPCCSRRTSSTAASSAATSRVGSTR